jgi:hypothetical protein
VLLSQGLDEDVLEQVVGGVAIADDRCEVLPQATRMIAKGIVGGHRVHSTRSHNKSQALDSYWPKVPNYGVVASQTAVTVRRLV